MARVGQLTPVQQIHLLGMYGLQFDLFDTHRRWFWLDDPRDNEVFLAIARLHRRPLGQQKLLRAQRVLSRVGTGRGRYIPGFRIGFHRW